MIFGVIMALRSAPAPQPVAQAPKPKMAPVKAVEMSDLELIRLGEPLVRKFLQAGSVEELLPLVREPARAEPRMRKLHPDGKVTAPGMAEFKPDELLERQGKVATIQIRDRTFQPRLISLVETPGGLKVDWEAWVGWSEISWKDFSEKRVKTPTLFRVVLEPVDYYNFGFSDETHWVSYRLSTLDGELVLYGYTERGSELDGRIRPAPEVGRVNATLMLKFPEQAETSSQVLIDGWLGNCWALENEPPP